MSRPSRKQPTNPAAPGPRPAGEKARPGCSGGPPRVQSALICLALATITVALFWPAMGHDFVNYDDNVYVTDNPHVAGGLSWLGIRWAFSNLEAGFWHPLTWLSILADSQLYGLRAWGHHLTSVLLHAASTVVLFLALRRLTGATWRSAFVAGLFGWHPLHVESVAWVSERKDVLSGLFWMLALWAYGRYAQESRVSQVKGPEPEVQSSVSRLTFQVSPSPLHASRFYLLSLVFFTLGLMSKPIVVTLPFVLLLLDYWPLQRFRLSTLPPHPSTLWRLIWEKLPFLAGALVFGVATIYAEKAVGALAPTTIFPLVGRMQNALLSCVWYPVKTFWPADLAAFYPYPEALSIWPVAWAALAGLTITALVLGAARTRPYLAVGWLWYGAVLLPVLGLIQVGGFARADRFTYLPLIGVFLALTWCAYELTRRWHHGTVALSAAGSAILILFFALARQQVGYWRDSETLFRHALAVTKNNWLAHNDLGHALEQKGQLDDAIRQFQEAIRLQPRNTDARYNLANALVKKGQLEEAIRQFHEAARLNPGYADVHHNLASALLMAGRIDDAIREFREALRLKPNYPLACNNLGTTLEQAGQLDDAIRQFQEAIRLKPGYADAHYNLGNVRLKKGQVDEAIRDYLEAIRLDPDHADAHYNLGNVWLKKGQTDEAIRQYLETIRLKPGDADARYNLGATLDAKGQTDDAIRQVQEALRLQPGSADAHNTLGSLYARKDQFDAAIREYREALRLQPAYAEAHFNLGRALVRQGQWAEAIAHYQQALALQPTALPAMNNLAWLLATCPEAALRNSAKALALAQELDRLSGGKDGDNLDVLAAAYAEAGKFPQAVEAAGRALALAVTQTNLNGQEIGARLKLYQAHFPYHEPPRTGAVTPRP